MCFLELWNLYFSIIRKEIVAAQGRWIFHLYDDCGREVLTGTTRTDPPAGAYTMAATYSSADNGLGGTGYVADSIALKSVSGLTAAGYAAKGDEWSETTL